MGLAFATNRCSATFFLLGKAPKIAELSLVTSSEKTKGHFGGAKTGGKNGKGNSLKKSSGFHFSRVFGSRYLWRSLNPC